MSNAYTLYASRQCGSMVAEFGFALAGVPVTVVDVAWEDTGWSSRVLGEHNPLGQVPTVLMPDGVVLTESLAILLHLHDRRPEAGLLPPIDHPSRAVSWRWLVFLVAAVYPTYTYADVPERFVDGDEAAGRKLVEGAIEHRKSLFRQVEGAAGAPWFLGDRWSAADVYVWAMVRWRPGPAWFAAECPKLHAIARRMDDHPQALAVAARNELARLSG